VNFPAANALLSSTPAHFAVYRSLSLSLALSLSLCYLLFTRRDATKHKIDNKLNDTLTSCNCRRECLDLPQWLAQISDPDVTLTLMPRTTKYTGWVKEVTLLLYSCFLTY